jgi:hypothetical protein
MEFELKFREVKIGTILNLHASHACITPVKHAVSKWVMHRLRNSFY